MKAELDAKNEGVDWENLSDEERKMRTRDALIPMAEGENRMINMALASGTEDGKHIAEVYRGVQQHFERNENEEEVKKAA